LVYLKRSGVKRATHRKAVNHGANAHSPHAKGHGRGRRAQHSFLAVRALFLIFRKLFSGHACNADGLLYVRANTTLHLFSRQARPIPKLELGGARGAQSATPGTCA